jgi:DNA-binding transcriptional regulator LsrR (DeoR family)
VPADELEKAARLHRAALAAQKALSEAAAARDEAVRDAVAAGWSQAEVARSLHVDRARINRIVKEGDQP